VILLHKPSLNHGHKVCLIKQPCRLACLYFLVVLSIFTLSHALGNPHNSSVRKHGEILILKSGEAVVYDEVIERVRRHLGELCEESNTDCVDAEIRTDDTNHVPLMQADSDLVITLGLQASEYAQRELSGGAIINAMVPDNTDKLSGPNNSHLQYPTVVLDQPPRRSLLLIKYLLPNAINVGYLYSPDDRVKKESLVKSAETLGLELVPSLINTDTEIGKGLSRIFSQIDVLLALPDIEIHNRKNVSRILLSTYRNNLPLIGFSSAYVKAGAIAAVFSTPDNIGDQLAELIVEHFAHRAIPEKLIYPKYFSVSLNRRVAHSLALQIPDDPAIIEALIKAAEQ
jgi:ABC-type uncharacterized transport system substrate-binding protein